jgi:uncharacterized protein YraI
MLSIEQRLLTHALTRPFLRDKQRYHIRALRGVVAHWTANIQKKANAAAHVRYFNTTDRAASAHYLVDDTGTIQCIPDNEVAFHVGGSHYRPDGVRLMRGSASPNYHLLGFEMCVNSDGDWEKTYRHSVRLAAHLLWKYRLTVDDLYRHYDITGKDCPRMMLDPIVWNAFKQAVEAEMRGYAPVRVFLGKVNTAELNVRTGPGIQYPTTRLLNSQAEVEGFMNTGAWTKIGDRAWVATQYIDISYISRYGVLASEYGVEVYTERGKRTTEVLPNGAGVLTIAAREGRLQIGENRWISDRHVHVLPHLLGVVSGTPELNIRRGPGTHFPVVGLLGVGTQVTLFEVQKTWYRIGVDRWVWAAFIALQPQSSKSA